MNSEATKTRSEILEQRRLRKRETKAARRKTVKGRENESRQKALKQERYQPTNKYAERREKLDTELARALVRLNMSRLEFSGLAGISASVVGLITRGLYKGKGAIKKASDTIAVLGALDPMEDYVLLVDADVAEKADARSEPLPPDQLVSRLEIAETVRAYLRGLSPMQQKVVEYRFFDNYTLEQAGSILSLSRERIRQIEQKALRRLRHPSRLMYLR